MSREVLEPVPHRRVVLTIPKRLRLFFATDRGVKMRVYERHGVAEYWIVSERTRSIERYVLEGGAYGDPKVFGPDRRLTTPLLPGFELPIDDVFEDL